MASISSQRARLAPDLTVPDAWDVGYRALSEETGFSVVDIDEAATTVRALVCRIASS